MRIHLKSIILTRGVGAQKTDLKVERKKCNHLSLATRRSTHQDAVDVSAAPHPSHQGSNTANIPVTKHNIRAVAINLLNSFARFHKELTSLKCKIFSNSNFLPLLTFMEF